MPRRLNRKGSRRKVGKVERRAGIVDDGNGAGGGFGALAAKRRAGGVADARKYGAQSVVCIQSRKFIKTGRKTSVVAQRVVSQETRAITSLSARRTVREIGPPCPHQESSSVAQFQSAKCAARLTPCQVHIHSWNPAIDIFKMKQPRKAKGGQRPSAAVVRTHR